MSESKKIQLNQEESWVWRVGGVRPGVAGRAQLTLPRIWNADLPYTDKAENPFGDVDTLDYSKRDIRSAEDVRVEAALKRGWELNKPRNAYQRAVFCGFLEEIIDALLTDRDAWYLGVRDKEDDTIWEACWNAEFLVTWLYGVRPHKNDIDNLCEFPLCKDTLNAAHARAVHYRNNFIRKYSEQCAQIPLWNEDPADVCNPNGSVDLWVALRAFKTWHYDDILERQIIVATSSDEALVTQSWSATDEERAFAAIWMQTAQIRENVAMGIMLHTAHLACHVEDAHWAHVSARRIYRSGPDRFKADAPFALGIILYVSRIVMGVMGATRSTIQNRDLLGFYTMLERAFLWSNTRQGSLLLLTAAPRLGEYKSFRKLYDAMALFEALSMMEHWAYVQMYKLKMSRLDGDDGELIKDSTRVLLQANLSLTNENGLERFAFAGVHPTLRARAEQLFSAFPARLRRESTLMSLFMRVTLDHEGPGKAKTQDEAALHFSKFLSNRDRLRDFCGLCVSFEPELVRCLTPAEAWPAPDTYALNFGSELETLLTIQTTEDEIRMRRALSSDSTAHEKIRFCGHGHKAPEQDEERDPFENAAFTIDTLKTLVSRAKTMGFA